MVYIEILCVCVFLLGPHSCFFFHHAMHTHMYIISHSGPHDWSITIPQQAGNAPQFHDDNGFDDNSGPDWNYVGQHYVDLGPDVYCHRATPTGKRDCNGHSAREGLIGRAHEQGALVYPSIGGWSLSDVFPELSASAEGRRNFAKNCVGLIREYNFDGIGK